MKRGRILNSELNNAIAKMGHGDLMIVCDAGFPIPENVWRVDLAILPDLPDLETVLELIRSDFIAERVGYAAEMAQNNPPLLAKVQRIFPDAEHTPIPHAEILGGIAAQAKVIVRTGAFDPWGNILLYSGVDAPVWFSKPGLNVPESYQKRVEQMQGGQQP
jgi:simple sugar transport system permease protein/D-ribose pyranase